MNEESPSSPTRVRGTLSLETFPIEAKLIFGQVRGLYLEERQEKDPDFLEYELTEHCALEFRQMCDALGLKRLDLLCGGSTGLKKEPSLDQETMAQRTSIQEKISSMGKNSTGLRFSHTKKVIFKSLRASVFKRFAQLAPRFTKYLEENKDSLIIPTIGMFSIEIK